MRIRDLCLMLLLSVVWGSSFLLIKVALREMAPLMIVAGRMTVGAVALGYVARWGRGSTVHVRPPARRFLVGAVLSVAAPNLLIAVASQDVPSGAVAILLATAPIFTVLLSARAGTRGRDVLSGPQLAGIATGFAGVAVVVAGRENAWERGSLDAVLPSLAVLLAAILAALGGLYNRRVFGGVRSLTVSAGQVGMSAAMLAGPALVWSRPGELPGWQAAGAVVALGLGATAVGYGLYYEILRSIGAARALTVNYLVTGVAVLLGTVGLHERLDAATAAGLGLILMGLFITTRMTGRSGGNRQDTRGGSAG